MRERESERKLSSFHQAVESSVARALTVGRVEVFTPSELPVDLFRRAQERLDDKADLMTVYGEVFRVVLDDLGRSNNLDVVMGESEMWDDGQPGFFLVRREVEQYDFRFGESVVGEVFRNRTTASGQRANHNNGKS